MFVDGTGYDQEKNYDENGNVVDIRYDLRFLINQVKGIVKFDKENNIVYIKALGKSATIDLKEVSKQDENLSNYEKHNVGVRCTILLRSFYLF